MTKNYRKEIKYYNKLSDQIRTFLKKLPPEMADIEYRSYINIEYVDYIANIIVEAISHAIANNFDISITKENYTINLTIEILEMLNKSLYIDDSLFVISVSKDNEYWCIDDEFVYLNIETYDGISMCVASELTYKKLFKAIKSKLTEEDTAYLLLHGIDLNDFN